MATIKMNLVSNENTPLCVGGWTNSITPHLSAVELSWCWRRAHLLASETYYPKAIL